MNQSRIFLALLLAGGLAACGDDDGGSTPTPTPDAGDDTGTDTTPGPDADDDTTPTPDADDDTTPTPDTTPDTDVPPQPTPEICNDGVDNSGNGLVDCDDPECSGTLLCQADPCDACTGAQICIGGTCEDPVAIGDYVPAEDWSYISGLTIPEEGCCFDFTGDGVPDNGLGAVIPLLAGIADFDIDELVLEAFADDDVTLLLEYREWPGQGTDGPAKLSFFLGTNDLDGDGEPDQDFDDVRAVGDGVFRINADSFGPAGAIIQFNTADYTGGTLNAGPSLFRLNFPIPGLIEGIDVLDLTIQAARLEAPLDSSDFRFTVNTGGVGGGKLGGIIPLGQIFDIIDQAARGCECAGIDASQPVIAYGEEGGFYNATCVQTIGSVASCTGVVCENLSTVCGFLPLVVDILDPDIDTDGSGVNDAISIGANLTMVSATIDENWFE